MTVTTQSLQSLNPANGELVGEVPVTPVEDIPALVARSRAAQREWRAQTPEARGRFLTAGGKKLVERADELGRLLTREMGKPLREAVGEVRGCGAGMEEEVAAMAAALAPEEREDEHTRSWIHRDPYGVCAAISPWNFPLAMPHWLVVPALMAGNTVILKPSEETPLIAQEYADVLNEFLPEDVLQVVQGRDEQGISLVASDVDLIAFTGSQQAGKHILASAAPGLKRVILELGGKDPLVVLKDADLDEAARFAAMNSFRNAGQVCVSTERIYVDESIAETFERKLAAHAAELQPGDGLNDGVRIGPMISSRQKERVLSQVRQAIGQGARLVAGGEPGQGNFLAPTVLADLTHEMDIMREETFGPVACVMRFRSEAEAVELANDTTFGLGAAVFGGDEERALTVARQLEAGMIGVNKSCGGASDTPWVGAKQSGYGFHSSKEGHRQFAQVRVVSVPKK